MLFLGGITFPHPSFAFPVNIIKSLNKLITKPNKSGFLMFAEEIRGFQVLCILRLHHLFTELFSHRHIVI